MNIKESTAAYENWLGKRITIVAADLKLKHQRMAEGAFPFLRATFYRWAQLWPEHCPELISAPAVLGVGDLHVENFGTWRDSEGRLIWGVNDFDEVCELPYTVDLVRLAVSEFLATAEGTGVCQPEDACEAILDGYTQGIQRGGNPFVLAEHHPVLRVLALNELRNPIRFWDKINSWPRAGKTPPNIQANLKRALPEPGLPFKIVHRQAGLGSLGRPRFTLVAPWRGGFIARETKPLVPSAWHCFDKKQNPKIFYADAITRAIRVADPMLHVRGQWLVRRIAPDCSRIELNQLPVKRDGMKLLHAMGFETANIHLGTPKAAGKIAADLRKRPDDWLYKAARAMEQAIVSDWKQWRE
jgi:Uncharacterized protein conserved in bacteria (DUF2252)